MIITTLLLKVIKSNY